RALVAAVVAHARETAELDTLSLSVDARSAAAIALYESLGFVAWGTDPDSFRTADGSSVDETHMSLQLR
ncbi:MAG: GNAT family N-acetyltransferase, partial [Myxococcota bacterium]|nr:GNAT family N-acetyltransferase [Myxococcota bacterium]